MSARKKIAIITSGGDCQAMNAAIRSVVLAARKYDIEVVGIKDGFYGMTKKRPGDYRVLHAEDVENIINRGGTVLNSARFDDFRDDNVIKIAAKNMIDEGIEALVVAGGDGSFRGGLDLLKFSGIPCIGIPSTIDNDITSTEYTLGFDTALRNTINMVDALRDTCNSHKRCNVVEVMGRNCGQIALITAIAAGASGVAIPESPEAFNPDETIDRMIAARKAGKRSFIVVFAEGAINRAETEENKKSALAAAVEDYKSGKIGERELSAVANDNYVSSFGEQFRSLIERRSSEEFAKYYEQTGDPEFKGEIIETKFARFAHVARGGAPTAYDRLIASQMGELAIELIAQGADSSCVCVQDGQVVPMDMLEAIGVDKVYREYLKTHTEDPEALAKLTPQQRKMYDFRFKSNEKLLKAAATLAEI